VAIKPAQKVYQAQKDIYESMLSKMAVCFIVLVSLSGISRVMA
jgi:hypothetical protein